MSRVLRDRYQVRCALFVLLVALLAAATADAADAMGYWVKIAAKVTGPKTVDVNVESNIPGAVLSIDLALQGQKDKDVFIGTRFIRVPIINGKGHAIVDGNALAEPHGNTLPPGSYAARAAFYPLWDENRATAAKLNISKPIEVQQTVSLSGPGPSVAKTKQKLDAQKWLGLNFSAGKKWNPGYWQGKLGTFEDVGYRGSGDPKILKMYYFAQSDVTLLVNVLKGEVVTFRLGLAHD